MQIKEIQFTNFRAFESFQLELEPRATIIVGRNATGKSTILDGIAIALGDWTRAFLPEEDCAFQRGDARLVAIDHAGVATTEQIFPVQISACAMVATGREYRWERKFQLTPVLGTRFPTKLAWTASEWGNDESQHQEPIWPVVAYYRTSRLWREGSPQPHPNWKNDAEDGLQSRAWGYHDALKAGSDRNGFEQWMAWREADRVQRLARAAEEGKDLRDVKSPQLEAVAAAATACLEGAKRLYYSANHRELRVDFETGPPIPFKSLSDGQRNIIALAADIAWRAAQLNPHLGAKAALETPGVVLIDELDLHLHPAWQLRVLDDLLCAFPKMQFIVTTHSPQVMSAAPRNAVRLVDVEHRVHRVDRLRGRDSNSILEDILGVPSRPPRWQKALDELAQYIEDGLIDEARALLAELEKEEFYADDAALVAARWEIALAQGDHAKD